MHPDLPVKRVMIAIDFSDPARYAFYAGLSLATKYGAETWVLHVSEPVRAFDYGKTRYIETKETIERVEEGVRRRIDELWAEKGLTAVDRRKVHIKIRSGKAAAEIVAASREFGADLLVIGHRGSDSLAEQLLGTNTERIVRDAPCTVLCVRAPATSP